jgi:ParE toxin of type II toxin-antitoxin system, parDE
MKKYAIKFTTQSLDDIEEAVNYYNEQLWGLGNKFLLDLDKVYKAIQLNPFFASVKYDNVRCAAFKKFPFSVHYEIDEKKEVVIIVAVFNTWKNPFW